MNDFISKAKVAEKSLVAIFPPLVVAYAVRPPIAWPTNPIVPRP